ncbi:hypothetical protein DQK91_14120 [Oceanidesulfovibrio marinus]|uniref:Phosphatidic acid phosphatase type 2/haloperoxidase domain-containing protein n=2 Tax=Oceanidesulfovibrio marinus TaxID=370038 RepID=A0A6P1ZHV9_9BACT|nr:hypothetical protein DQK91_14120 [Oceanidesulfovibrio marinus]
MSFSMILGYVFFAVLIAALAAGGVYAWPAWLRLYARTPKALRRGSSRLTIPALACCAVAAALLLALLTAAAHRHPGPFQLDAAASAMAAWLQLKPFPAVFAAITHMANGSTLLAVAVVGVLLIAALARQVVLWPFMMTVLGSQITTWLLKYWVARPRPDLSEVAPLLMVVSPSFPSAHAAGSLSVYGFLGLLALWELSSARVRVMAGYWLLVFLALIGASRVYVGVHFATDVLGGWLTGVVWLCLGTAAQVYARRKPEGREDGPPEEQIVECE